MKEIKDIVLSILGIVVIVLIVFGFCNWKEEKLYKQQIQEYKDSNAVLKVKIEKLLFQIDSLENDINFYEENIRNKEKEIVNLRNKKYEKIDSVINLSLDKSIEFLSKYLSKENDIAE